MVLIAFAAQYDARAVTAYSDEISPVFDKESKMDIGKKTALYDAHAAAGASMVRQDGWELPAQ